MRALSSCVCRWTGRPDVCITAACAAPFRSNDFNYMVSSSTDNFEQQLSAQNVGLSSLCECRIDDVCRFLSEGKRWVGVCVCVCVCVGEEEVEIHGKNSKYSPVPGFLVHGMRC